MADADDRHLVVLMNDRRAGVIEMDVAGRFWLTYDDEWREDKDATPLSLSMPLAQPVHHDATVRAFLWGLLPDSEHVLERWARTYQVSAGNPFALLQHVGEDCAGAALFVTPERVGAVTAGKGQVQWLDDDEVADRLRVLHRDPTAWHIFDTGQFSLAGAQSKTALYREPHTGRWGVPSGAMPTTHILKPAVTGLDDHDLNEHLCLTAARHVGLSAASTSVESFAGERVIVVQRYDRLHSTDGTVSRIHQEDACQAAGTPPTRKYQSEGGPTPEQIIQLLRQNVHPTPIAAEQVDRFVDALAYNWIIGGTDAHAKNYSLLLSGAQARLAPMYDVASALAYDDIYVPKLRMAMKIGGEDGLQAVGRRHWHRFATTNGLGPDETIARVDGLAERTPDAFAAAAGSADVTALRSRLPARLVERVAARAADCRRQLASISA